MNIAIFGGSFNPVHREHVNLVKAAARALNADKILIIPTATTPCKGGKIVAGAKDRLAMCRLAFKDIPQAEVSDMEIAAGGVSYSYITCEKIAAMYPSADRYFIMGCDMLQNFAGWKNPRRILACTKIAACAREDGETFKTAARNFEKTFSQQVKVINHVGDKVSSTACRAFAFAGESIEEYAGKEVNDYITINGTYCRPNLAKVKNLLKQERWLHTLRVACMAAKNCARVGWSEEQALTAAILHDCAKYIPLNSEYLKGFTPPEGIPDPVMHQFSGAYMAANYFGVTDGDVINAIKYHTSGRADMSGGEKLIFLCDMLESGRSFEGVDGLRKIFESDIDECLYAALEHQVNYLKTTGAPVYYLTEKAYHYLKENK